MPKRLNINILRNEKGIALMIVLWIAMLLIVMTLASSVMVRTEVFSTLTLKDQMENKYLAEAGLQRAMMEIIYRNANISRTLQNDETDFYMTDGTVYQGKLDGGYYSFSITDESGKININAMTDESGMILNNLLVNMGVEKDQADTIVDSILDWRDGDNLHRLHGAETDYYMSLPQPYKAKDAEFANLDELLLVRGMTPALLYGTEEKPGLIQYLTIYSSSGQINIMAAKPEILKAIPSMTDELVQAILDYRTSDNGKKDGSDLQSMLSMISTTELSKIMSFITVTDSDMYSVEVVGYKQAKTGKYPIKAVVAAVGANQCWITFYQSPAHVEIPNEDANNKHL